MSIEYIRESVLERVCLKIFACLAREGQADVILEAHIAS